VIFIFWVAQFGVFGAIYIGGKDRVNGEYTQSVTRMKVAVAIDGINMVMWFWSAVGGVVWCCAERKVTRRTDRMDLEREARGAFVPRQRHLDKIVEGDVGFNDFDEKKHHKEFEKELESFDGGADEATLKGDDKSSMVDQ
jgi:hypothetical protein